MSVDVVCGKCGAKIANMRMLKPIREITRPYNNKCPSCGQTLSIAEFSVDVQKN
jgi:ribosomal protein S27AE